MVRALIRWFFTIGLILTTLASGQGFMQCTTVSDSDAISANDDLPECCREGFCPHHAHQEAAKARAARSEKDDCICRMSSRDSQTTVLLTPTVAELTLTQTGVIDLSPSGLSSDRLLLHRVPPDLRLPTPPPRA
jgi:hypothetical protein